MKIFAIRDDEDKNKKNVAYLFYYEHSDRFYIELPDDADPWDTPLLLSSFLKRGERTVNAYWSRLWVQQRIIPSDRQNLGGILKDNGLESYDEFKLLTMNKGRCAQDSYYLVQVSEQDLPASFAARFNKRIEDVVPLKCFQMLVFFRDGRSVKCDMKALLKDDRRFLRILSDEAIFNKAEPEPGGYGVRWGEDLCVADDKLYSAGADTGLGIEDIECYVQNRTLDTAEAAEEMGCSKQNIDDLVKRGKLHSLKENSKYRLFSKREIRQRMQCFR